MDEMKTMDDLSYFVPDVKFELIPIKNLVSNQNYQRNLSCRTSNARSITLTCTKSTQ